MTHPTGSETERDQGASLLCTTATAARRYALLRAGGALRAAAFGFPPWLASRPL